MSITSTPLGPTTGLEITGLHGRALVDRAVAADCLAALDRHGVVVYRGADIGDDDLVIWDNTGMLHRAQPYAETSRRLMHRTGLAGEEAVA